MSENEEMYLVTIARIHESDGLDYVPLSKLADRLEVQPVSANQMIHKLEGEGLVKYAPYKGVALTLQGREKAAGILRKRRLWEVFLVEHLHFSVNEADLLACRLEHFIPSEAAEHLSNFLGNPVVSPAGESIPARSSGFVLPQDLPISQLQVDACGVVTRIAEHPDMSKSVFDFLTSQGIRPGVRIEVAARGSEGSQLLKIEACGEISISHRLAEMIYVRKNEDSQVNFFSPQDNGYNNSFRASNR